MLINETKDKLVKMRLHGIYQALEKQLEDPNILELSFEERIGFLIEQEYLVRENQKLAARLRQAKFKQPALVENIDFKTSRGITKSLIQSLASCSWIDGKQNVIITGATGTGKTYIGTALAQKACRQGYTSIYYRVSRLFEELSNGRGDGSYIKLLDRIAKKDVLVLDDWGLVALNENQSRDLLEVLEDRYDNKSTIIISQVPVKNWYELVANVTTADAILDRVVHNSHKIELKGGSMRKKLKEVKSEDQNPDQNSLG
jgi:DNA replication protein DnaC